MTERNETAEGVATARVCRFPGCTRPAEEGDGRGRPPAYCDDPAHTRAAAFRARREAGTGGEPTATAAAAEAEPVTFARVRAGLLVERVEAAVTALSTMTSEVVAELRTLGDVEAVEVELESVSASADQRAAEARAVAAEAETRRRRAEVAAVEAEQLRDEAEAAAEEALAAETHARETAQEAEDERDAALAQTRDLREELAAARAEAARVQGELDQVQERAGALDEALAEQIAAVTRLGEHVHVETTRAERAEATIVDLRRALDERDQAVATLQGQVGDQRTELAQVQVRLEEQTSQREQLREQVTARDERIHALEDEHGRDRAEVAALTAQLHAEQAAARVAAEVAERTATERVAEVRTLYEERIVELRRQGKTR